MVFYKLRLLCESNEDIESQGWGLGWWKGWGSGGHY